jgi:hypothetical protein
MRGGFAIILVSMLRRSPNSVFLYPEELVYEARE